MPKNNLQTLKNQWLKSFYNQTPEKPKSWILNTPKKNFFSLNLFQTTTLTKTLFCMTEFGRSLLPLNKTSIKSLKNTRFLCFIIFKIPKEKKDLNALKCSRKKNYFFISKKPLKIQDHWSFFSYCFMYTFVLSRFEVYSVIFLVGKTAKSKTTIQ